MEQKYRLIAKTCVSTLQMVFYGMYEVNIIIEIE